MQQQILKQRFDLAKIQDANKSKGIITDGHEPLNRILLLQHSPTYTLGRGAKEEHLTFLNEEQMGKVNYERARKILARQGGKRLSLSSTDDEEHFKSSCVFAPNGVPLYRVERGGEVTFHGPGQIVCYPLLDLTRNPFKKDLHWYLRSVEEVIIRVLSKYEIVGTRDDINSGVFVGKNKICAVGLSSSRWITTHGFALNVNCDMAYFDISMIMPCGLRERGVTSMNKLLGHHVEIEGVSSLIIEAFRDVFNVEVEEAQ